MQKTQFLVKGDTKLLYVLRQLREASQRRVMRPAIAKAIRPIARAARSFAPKGETGALKASIQSKVVTVKKTGEIWAAVGILKGPRGWRVKNPEGATELRITSVGEHRLKHRFWQIAKKGRLTKEIAEPGLSTGTIYARLSKMQIREIIKRGYNVAKQTRIAELAKPGHYAHLVERGHGGPRPAKPHPFLSKAYNSGRAVALATIQRETWSNLVKHIGKLK